VIKCWIEPMDETDRGARWTGLRLCYTDAAGQDWVVDQCAERYYVGGQEVTINEYCDYYARLG
jgi:hypothetical protein